MYTSYIDYAPKGSIYLGQYRKLSDAQKACALVNIFWTQNYKNYSVTA